MGTETTKLLAERVKATSENAGVPILRLSELTGIPRSTLTRKLNGHSDFTIPELETIAKRLDVKPSGWLAGIPGFD